MDRDTVEGSEGTVKSLADIFSLEKDSEDKLLICKEFLEQEYDLILKTHEDCKKEDIDNLFIEKVFFVKNYTIDPQILTHIFSCYGHIGETSYYPDDEEIEVFEEFEIKFIKSVYNFLVDKGIVSAPWKTDPLSI